MKIRRISAMLIALVVLTIGGVYASWMYAENKVTSQNANKGMIIASVDDSAVSGTFAVSFTEGDLFTIDQENSATGDFHAKLVVNPSAKVTITFTPDAKASEAVKTNAVAAQYTFSVVTNGSVKVDENDRISETGTARNIVTLNNVTSPINWAKQADGTFKMELNADALDAIIDINTFLLDTLASYNAFKLEVAKIQLQIAITDIRA